MTSDNWRARISVASTAFFLDVDGTLLDFKSKPEDVVSDAPLRALLVSLHDATGGALALVSGRTIADLDRIMSPLGLPAAGTHGAELRFGDGRRENTSAAALDDVRAAVSAFVAEHPALRLEDKGASLAIHYRAAPELSPVIASFLENLVTHADLMVQHGKMVAEVKAAGSDKGIAIEVLMRSAPFAGREPLFIGDDLTDEHGFEAVNRLGGISIKVSDGLTAAQYNLTDVSAVHDLLHDIVKKGATYN